ncbi:hypothetical protein [Alteromonas macleodii]|uniref:Uncharacterized protein n=1 Tax=Alteromonas macleodii TaxID=28108 RepID=A0A6T9Y1N4_ALTMA|nr:hypothetical protein [Alteromonas macleodii]CAB9494204.1 conserved membrane protein of unknown function [Alteromonas macleodii]
MKVTQIFGLIISILAFTYYMSFAQRLDSPDAQGSVALGIGLLSVFFLALISAILLIPTSIILLRKKARERHNFNGLIWNTVLGFNTALAFFYTFIGLWSVGTFIVIWAGR